MVKSCGWGAEVVHLGKMSDPGDGPFGWPLLIAVCFRGIRLTANWAYTLMFLIISIPKAGR